MKADRTHQQGPSGKSVEGAYAIYQNEDKEETIESPCTKSF